MAQQLPTDSLDASSRVGSAHVAVSEVTAGSARAADSNSKDLTLTTVSTPATRRLAGFLRGFWWIAYIAAWCGVLTLATLALLRIFFHDATYLLTCINAFTLYVYLPAYAALAWAVWQRRWVLGAASGFVVLCHAAWVRPDFTPARPLEASAVTAEVSPTLTIFYANVSAYNATPTGILEEVASEDPDVIVFVEYWRRWHELVMSSSFVEVYQYGTGITERRVGEIAVFSKFPITMVERHWPTGRQICITDLQVAGESLRLFCLHGPRPMNLAGHGYANYWTESVPLIKRQSAPLIVIGDFNATQHSKVYQELTSAPLGSAHRDQGRGYAVTWPNGKFTAPPIRIDHALLSDGIECLRIREGEGRGSDHKPLIFDVRIRREAASGAPLSAPP